MTLIRQIWLLMLGSLLLAWAGSVWVNVKTSRDQFETQLRLKNHDNAAALALALSQQQGNRELMSLLASAQFDTGYYESVQLRGRDGGVWYEQHAQPQRLGAPDWFVRWVPIQSTPGVAKVSDGWKALGEVHLRSHAAFAYEALWKSTLEAAATMAGIAVVALLLAWAVVGRVRVALAASVTQAQALVDGRFLTMPEPKAPELRQLTQAMNHMVDRLKGIFHSQAEQVDEYRRLSNCDPLTGISHRRHFMAQLDDAFQREDGPEQSSLVLLRIAELGELNQRLGHERVDSLVVTVTQALQQYAKRVPACLMGRLNGSDFALFIPVPAMAQECGMALSAALRMVLPQFDAQASAYVGAVPVGRHHTLSQVMSLADTALSRAEAAGPFGVELLGSSSQEAHTPMGEAERRMKLEYALSAHKLQLAEFPVLHGDGSLLHLECPMRLQLQEGGPFLPAAHWMPWALRAQLMERVDERSLELALASIAADGRSRCVHMSRAVLSEGGLMSRMHKRLTEAKELSAKLWVEVPEALAIERPEILRVLARQLRPLKVKVGIEHSGGQVARIERMFEVGLDFIKLDGATTRGLATDEHKQQFVHGTVTLLRTMCSEVIAEGVLDEADARALWRCGVSGITGPWASTQAPQWMRSL